MEPPPESIAPSPKPRVDPEIATELADLLDGSLSVENFIATVVHEAAQPLTAIQVLATALRTSGDTIDEQQRTSMLLDIEEQAQFLNDLSNWMLTPFGRETVVLDELVERIAARARPLALEHNLVTDLGAGDTLVNCEKIRIEASIRNLIRNAAVNSKPGSDIILHTFEEDGMAVVKVCDFGVGIPDSERENIFKPYASLTGQRTVASGLGLFIVRGCARRHGGDARIATSGPEGTGMEFTLRALASDNLVS